MINRDFFSSNKDHIFFLLIQLDNMNNPRKMHTAFQKCNHPLYKNPCGIQVLVENTLITYEWNLQGIQAHCLFTSTVTWSRWCWGCLQEQHPKNTAWLPGDQSFTAFYEDMWLKTNLIIHTALPSSKWGLPPGTEERILLKYPQQAGCHLVLNS